MTAHGPTECTGITNEDHDVHEWHCPGCRDSATLKELIKGYELREGIILGHRDTAREEAEEAITEKYREQEKYEKEKARAALAKKEE